MRVFLFAVALPARFFVPVALGPRIDRWQAQPSSVDHAAQGWARLPVERFREQQAGHGSRGTASMDWASSVLLFTLVPALMYTGARTAVLAVSASASPKKNAASSAGVESVTSREEFFAALDRSRKKKGDAMPDGSLVCIKYYANWCTSCKAIAPKYSALAKEYGDRVEFLEVEFSANKELFKELEVKRTPCVQFYRGESGRLSTVVCGPSKFAQVRQNLDKYLEGESEDLECVLDDTLQECTDVSELYGA
jgi:thioredoxin 1